MNYENVRRYNPELDYRMCYYEGDSPRIQYDEELDGKVVMYSDYLFLLNAYLLLRTENQRLKYEQSNRT